MSRLECGGVLSSLGVRTKVKQFILKDIAGKKWVMGYGISYPFYTILEAHKCSEKDIKVTSILFIFTKTTFPPKKKHTH